MDDTYQSFLQLLDYSQLVNHINSLSQEGPSGSHVLTSTPRKLDLVRSIESDPFDDNLDSELLKIGKLSSLASLDGVPCNQLVLQRTEVDTSEDEEIAETGVLNEIEIARNDEVSIVHFDDAEVAKGVGVTNINDIDVDSARDDIIPNDNFGNIDGPESSESEDNTYSTVGDKHKFGDYATYFRNKFLKQQMADKAYVDWDKERRKALGQSTEPSRIFEGCMIYVNGNTIPTLAVVHKLVILHGGTFLNYLHNKGAATHIICDRLTPRKRVEFKNYKVVKAKWVADCVEQNKLLDWKEYRLIESIDHGQKQLGFEKLEEVVEMGMEVEKEVVEMEVVEKEVVEKEIVEMEVVAKEENQILAMADMDDELDFEDDLENLGEDDLDFNGRSDVALVVTEDPGNLNATTSENSEITNAPHISQFKTERITRQHTAMDANHPDFLKHFFANSRLHHLSTWKAALRSKFVRLVAAQPPHPMKSISGQKLILHIDFDCFFATASALSHPELDIHKDPIAVSHGGGSSDVASCNYIARKSGVSNGMWLGRAKKQCPELKVIDYDFGTYETCSSAFYNYLISKNLFDSIFPVLIDEVLVDATTACEVNGNISEKVVFELSEQIRSDIYRLTNCSVSIGASKNVLLAKLAIKKAKPDGFYHLNHDIEAFLEHTKVRDIPGIGRSLSYRLAEELQHGSGKDVTIGDVKNLTLTRLSHIFGEKTGQKLYDNFRGVDETDIVLDLSTSESLLGRKSVSVDINFGIRFNTHAQAETFLMRLAKELHSRMIDLGVCGTSLSLKIARRAPNAPVNPPKFLGMGHCNFFSKSSRLGVPTNDWGIIGSEMKSLLRILNIPAPELRGIAVSMTRLEDINAVKKQRQQMLQFEKPKEPKKIVKVDYPEYSEPVEGSDSIDWDVFNQLPEDIRRELKLELLRRGIPVTRREKPLAKTSPTKHDSGKKVYMQQLFPTQVNGPFKQIRVVESPKKKRRVHLSPTKSPLPIKREPSPTPFNQTVSYDEEVLNEIPSSIRNEFYNDLEWHTKNRRLGYVPIKQRMKELEKDRQVIVESEITLEWIAQQPTISKIPSFSGLSKYSEVRDQLLQWVRMSVCSQGPHSEDLEMFSEYIEKLTRQRNFNRSIGLLKVIESEIQNQRSVALLSDICPQAKSDIMLGIEDWKRHCENMKDLVASICKNYHMTVEF